jgi:hypothetical protein
MELRYSDWSRAGRQRSRSSGPGRANKLYISVGFHNGSLLVLGLPLGLCSAFDMGSVTCLYAPTKVHVFETLKTKFFNWSKYFRLDMLLSRHQNTGQNRDIEIANRSFENVSQFKYLGTTVTNQNLIQEEIKRRLSSGNACYHSVHSLLSSHLLSKNLEMRI